MPPAVATHSLMATGHLEGHPNMAAPLEWYNDLHHLSLAGNVHETFISTRDAWCHVTIVRSTKKKSKKKIGTIKD